MLPNCSVVDGSEWWQLQGLWGWLWREDSSLLVKMHQLSPFRHAPALGNPGAGNASLSGSFVRVQLRLSGMQLPNSSSSSSGSRATITVVERDGGRQKRRSGGAVRCGDEAKASAAVEAQTAWEIDLGDEDVRVLAKFKSLYNFVQVLEVARRADHSLAGCRLLLLDRPGNIQSVYHPYKVLTDSYYDVFATLPPLLPDGPVGIFGLGAGTAARLIHHFWPRVELHGWELDPCVVMVARQFFDLAALEEGKRPDSRRASAFEVDERDTAIVSGSELNDTGRLVVHVGDALGCKAPAEEGFAGLIVDLFSDGSVIPALQQPQTWQRLRELLKPGGRIMVNCGGSCVEADDKSGKDGETTMDETLEAMAEVFPDEVFQFKLPGKGNNSVALSGPPPDLQAWEQALPQVLVRDGGVMHGWTPVS